jgi:predicted phosphodiesterase
MKTGTPNKHRSVWITAAVIAVFLICQPVISAQSWETNYSAMAPLSPMGPVVSETSQNSTIIRIVANITCAPVIGYANDSWFSEHRTYDHELSAGPAGTIHAIPLTGLGPATLYHYRVTGCGISEKDRTFTTFPKAGSCSFIVYGDSREQTPLYTQTDRHKIVADRIAEEPGVRFVINAGDLVAETDDPSEWARFFDATDRLRSVTTYVAVPGNHDADRPLFQSLFGTDRVHYFDCGDTRIILLDSTDASSMTLAEQARWIRSEAGSDNKVKIAFLHHPVYTSDEKHYGGFENLQQILVPAFQESGIRLVFNSHVHAFEEVKRDGITYITEARGGAPAYPLNQTRIPGSVTAYENTLGYSRVTVDPDAGIITVDVIRVADVSEDLRTVTTMYPVETVNAQIRIPVGSSTTRLQDISGKLCFLNGMKDSSFSHNSERNIADWLP